MNDFLENLEIGEDKIKLPKEVIKAIMKEHGKSITTETQKVEDKYKADIDNYKTTIDGLKEQISKAPKSEEIENLNKKIADYEQKEADRIAKEQAEKEEQVLTNNILTVFGDKKFTSDYAKNGLMNDIKAELKKEENKGLGIQQIFDNLTKDSEGIFANPNQVQDQPGMGDTDTTVTKDVFDKMSYNQRIEFKQNNPELFEKYNN
jgi:transketolase